MGGQVGGWTVGWLHECIRTVVGCKLQNRPPSLMQRTLNHPHGLMQQTQHPTCRSLQCGTPPPPAHLTPCSARQPSPAHPHLERSNEQGLCLRRAALRL
eukprot:42300-Chlamydomonas_euryale.AAC.1